MTSTTTTTTRKQRVCVIGAGAAGTAAAWSLSLHPQKFDVTVYEKTSQAGGVATSEHMQANTVQSSSASSAIPNEVVPWINDGVQGGAPSYRNVCLLLEHLGFAPHPVQMKVSFGKNETSWNNTTETQLVRELRDDIERFGRVLVWIHRLEFIFTFVPIDKVLHWFGFSQRFRNHMVFPLTALFFGTGNQTPNVSAAIVARVFLDPELRLFDYDSRLLLSQTPDMFAFPSLREIYQAAVKNMTQPDKHVQFQFGCGIKRVLREDNLVHVIDERDQKQTFDHIIFACDAETALKSLATPTWLERKILGNVRYYDDITITHQDVEYMQKHYDIDVARHDQYFIRTDPQQPEKLEMSFNLSNYQPQLAKFHDASTIQHDIFQTIFLDKNDDKIWTINDIKPDKILLRKWWHQFAHTWQHFAFTVPFIQFLQHKQHTSYCGAYTLVNTHEIAVISGLAAAHRLGANYPFAHDRLAHKQFQTYLTLAHGVWPLSLKIKVALGVGLLLYLLFVLLF